MNVITQKPISGPAKSFAAQCLLAIGMAALATGPGRAADWKPAANVEIVIPSGPSGGLDVAGRIIKNQFDKAQLVSVTSIVINKPGAGGSLAYQYLNQFPGNGHYFALATSAMVTNKLMGIGKIGPDDLTMISKLFSDNIVVLVRADSPLKDARALVARLRENPRSLSLGIATALGGANHIALATALKAAGVDVRNTLNVVYKSGGDAMIGLLSGDVEVFPVAVSAAVGNLKSGRVRALAIASTRRMGGELASIPTWREQGIPADYAAWRVIVGPRGLDQDQVRYWDTVMSKLSTLPDWKAALDRGYSVGEYLNNRDTREFVEQQLRSHRAILGDLGLEQ